MKINKKTLKKIIKQELNNYLNESKDSVMLGAMAASMFGLVKVLKEYNRLYPVDFNEDEVIMTFDKRDKTSMEMLQEIKPELNSIDSDYYTTSQDDSFKVTINIPIADYAKIVQQTNEDPLRLEDKNEPLWNKVQQIDLEYNPELGYKSKE
tara:strand:- start:9512 stop:9964 length:453 start_codon:yes stop_codon:yes gene_type:complete